jgi:geranylgeranyl reductase family protein
MGWDYDVIVVGAGPGGSTAARLCAQEGLKTLLIEKERLPRYKVCGGCLSARTIRLLGFDLSSVVENTIQGAKFTYCMKDPLFIPSEKPVGFMVMRSRFDQLLVQKTVEQGTEVLDGEKVVAAWEVEGGIEISLEQGRRLRCQYLIGADGAESVVTRAFSLLSTKKDEKGFGLQSEVPYGLIPEFPKDDLHFVHLDFGRIPFGYSWVFPKGEGLSIGIGGLLNAGKKVNIHQHFEAFLQDLGYVRRGELKNPVGHRLPCFNDETRPVGRGRVLLVGDAAYFLDPFTGEGIYYAVRSGMLAAQAILQSKDRGDLPAISYDKKIREVILEDLKWALHVSRIIYRFTQLSYRTLKQYPELGQLCIEVLEGETAYHGFVIKVKERIKDLLKGRLGERIRKAMMTPWTS